MLYLAAACASLYSLAQIADPVLSLRQSAQDGTGMMGILGQANGDTSRYVSRLHSLSSNYANDKFHVDPSTGNVTLPDSLSVDELNALLAGRSIEGMVPDDPTAQDEDESSSPSSSQITPHKSPVSPAPAGSDSGSTPVGNNGTGSGQSSGGAVVQAGGANVHTDPTVRAWFEQAVTAQHKGQLTRAEQLYLKILQRDPKDVGVHRNLSIVYYQEGRFDKSWQEVHAVEKLGRKMPGGFIDLLKKAMPDPEAESSSTNDDKGGS